jgi:hypothetical protein
MSIVVFRPPLGRLVAYAGSAEKCGLLHDRRSTFEAGQNT